MVIIKIYTWYNSVIYKENKATEFKAAHCNKINKRDKDELAAFAIYKVSSIATAMPCILQKN